MKHFRNIEKFKEINSKTAELSKLAERMTIIPDSVRKMIENQNRIMSSIPKIEIPKYDFPKLDIPSFEHLKLNIPDFKVPKFDFINSELLESLKKLSEIGKRIKNNPELQFVDITDLEILNLKSAE
jgi:hypothetical protein